MPSLKNLTGRQLESLNPRIAEGIDFTRLVLTPEQAFVLTRITGADSLHALARLSPLGYEKTLDWFEELLSSGVLTASGWPDLAEPEEAAVSPADPWQNERAALKAGSPLNGPLYRTLMPLGTRSASGTFLLETDGIICRMALAQGALTGMDSSQPPATSRIGDLLREAGLISEAELEWAAGEARKAGKRLGEQLVQMGLVTESDIRQILIRQTGHRVTGLLDRQQGRTAFIEHRPASENPAATPIARLITQHLRLQPPALPPGWSDLRQGRFQLAAMPSAPFPAVFGLDMAEQYLLEEMAGGKASLEEISEKRGLDLVSLERMASLFIELGLVRLQPKPAAPSAPTRPPKISDAGAKVERLAVTPSPATPAVPAKETAKPGKPLAEFPSLEEMHKRLEKQDHFEIMQVHWSASTEKLDQACRQRIMDLDRHMGGLTAAERKAWEPVMERFRQIRATLVDRDSRTAYRKQAMDPTQRIASAQIEFEKGETALFVNRDFATALGHLETAAELDPDDPSIRYSHWLAQALRARESGDTAKSNQFVERIISQSRNYPSDSAAWLYTGYVYLQSRREKEAREAFLNALKADPDNAEAKKELDRMR